MFVDHTIIARQALCMNFGQEYQTPDVGECDAKDKHSHIFLSSHLVRAATT